jgi:hypothetical protein
MATFTLFEFSTLTAGGEPVHPPSKTTTAIAVDTPTQLTPSTRFAAVVPSADMFFAVGGSGITAGAGSSKVLANVTAGFNVAENARPYVVGH